MGDTKKTFLLLPERTLATKLELSNGGREEGPLGIFRVDSGGTVDKSEVDGSEKLLSFS